MAAARSSQPASRRRRQHGRPLEGRASGRDDSGSLNSRGLAMPITQDHISSSTPMGANLLASGATFRVWAPDAEAVYVNGVFGETNLFRQDTDPGLLLQQ